MKATSPPVILLMFVLAGGMPLKAAFSAGGCQMHVNGLQTGSAGLTGIKWRAEIRRYELVPNVRLEFNTVEFSGKQGRVAVGAWIQSVTHIFDEDSSIVTSRQPGLGLYLSVLASPPLTDSQLGVTLDVSPSVFPNYGRVFENIDGGGYVGKNIYTRASLGSAVPERPINIEWTVEKSDIVVDPQGNFSKNLAGQWVHLRGTLVRWRFNIAINGVPQDVATFYLPIEVGEYLNTSGPLILGQEYQGFEGSQVTLVHYKDMRVTDGTNWYPIQNFRLASCFDDLAGNLDKRFGWQADETSLISTSGEASFITSSSRRPGDLFNLTVGRDCHIDLDRSLIAASASGLLSNLAVTASAGCFWAIQTPDPWITIQAGNQTDSKTVAVQISSNPLPLARGSRVMIGDQDLLVSQSGRPDGATLAPIVALPDGLLSGALRPETYVDTRERQVSPTSAAVQPMAPIGVTTITSGIIQSTGPTFSGNGGFPFALVDASRGVVIAHPCAGDCADRRAATIAFCAPASLLYRAQGAFARATSAAGAGVGVQAILFRNYELANPIWSSSIGTNHQVNPNDYFGGSSAVSFDVTASLKVGECMRAGVFPLRGANDGTFGATAIKFQVTALAPTSTGIAVLGVTNSASYRSDAFSPGEVVTIYGRRMGATGTIPAAIDPATGRLATLLGGSRVLIDGVAAPLIYSSDQQSSVIIPYRAADREFVSLVAEFNGAQSFPFDIRVTQAVPGFFTLDGSGDGHAVVFNQDGSLNLPTNPAAPGEIVTFYGTGEGKTTLSVPDGSIAKDLLPKPAASVSAKVSGKVADVLYIGGVPGVTAGVFQLNLRIPSGTPAGNQPVLLTIGSARSQAHVTVVVK